MATKLRVYGVNLTDIRKRPQVVKQLTDAEFITDAESQGLIWTIDGFENAFNEELIGRDNMLIRFIRVTF